MSRFVAPMPLLAILLCSLLLSIPALVNGYPLVYSDSGTYVRQAIALTGEPNRHPYYSLFLFPFHLRISLWPIVFVQGIFVSTFLYLIVKVIDYKRPLLFLTVLTAILSLLTSLPWFSGEIMPDVFTGLVILAIFLLAFAWDRLSSAERWFLVLVFTMMLSFHTTFPPLTILMSGFVLAVHLLRGVPRRRILQTQAMLLGPVGLALSAMVLYSYLLIHQVTILPATPWLMLTTVIADGPGRAYLNESCRAGARYELCAYLDELPTAENKAAFVNEFQFSSESPLTKVYQKLGIDGIRVEASDIVIKSLLRYPFWQIEQSLIDFAQQLTMFRGIEPSLCPATDNAEQLKLCLGGYQITKVVSRYFPSELNQFMDSLQNRNQLPFGLIYSVDVTVVILSMIYCVVLAYRWWRPGGRPQPPFSDLFAVILVGIVSNAALTGTLSAPADRYQGRVIWLLPFFVVLYVGRLTGFRPEPIAAPRRDQPYKEPAEAQLAAELHAL